MEITHRTNNLRIAPRKLRLVIDKVRHLDANKALGTLSVVPNKGAAIASAALASAIQVAKDNNIDPSTLVIQRVWADEGTSLKRLVGASRGRMTRIMKKYSHLSFVLVGNEPEKRNKRAAKPSAKTAVNDAALPEPSEEKGE